MALRDQTAAWPAIGSSESDTAKTALTGAASGNADAPDFTKLGG